ncbi:MAG: hypothetical protein ACM31P_20380 [Actinomycetota bacterium]
MEQKPNSTLEKYVGRIVSLNKLAFDKLIQKAKRGADADNCFLVAEVNREMRKLICYGANTRIAVGASEVFLI